jgi:Tol biopolymer transport system component
MLTFLVLFAVVLVGQALAAFSISTQRANLSSSGGQANAGSYNYAGSLSPNGRYAVFESDASNLVSGDTNGVSDVFVKDLQTGVIQRVSVTASGTQGNAASGFNSISADGRYVVFQSDASNLVPGDTNGTSDIFVKDRQTGSIRRVNVTVNGTQGNNYSLMPAISGNGGYVAFTSEATNLVSGDTNGVSDVFVKDLQTGTIQRVSVAANGTQGNDFSQDGSLSNDGRYVVFDSAASNLVAGSGSGQVYVKDRQTGAIQLISATSSGTPGDSQSFANCMSSDGRYVAFDSLASNLVAGSGSGQVYVKDRQTGAIQQVSVAADGSHANGPSGSNFSGCPALSANGRYVVFSSSASNLVPGDTNGVDDIFIKDRQTGAIQLLSVASGGGQSNGTSSDPAISGDASRVLYFSDASNLVSADTNGVLDAFVTSLQTQTTLTPGERIRNEALYAYNQAAKTSSNPLALPQQPWLYLASDMTSFNTMLKIYGSNAFVVYKPSKALTTPGVGGQCKFFANLVLLRSGVYKGTIPVNSPGHNYATINIRQAQVGDIIQRSDTSPHTAIVVAVSTTGLTVVDSNWGHQSGIKWINDEMIQKHDITFTALVSAGYKAWRAW